jgi:unconventional prefoldin RPB5 interactor 1
MDSSGLAQVERQRVELEKNIAELRKALRHWQTWEIEYEGLREEIASLPAGSHESDILAIAKDFQAELVDDKELRKIIGGEGGPSRNQAQIVDLLAKRVEYVSRNARTIEKQLSDAQKKRNALLLAEEPEYREDAGLPLTDITEELDEHGNIVSSKLETPVSTAPHLVDVLKKAGVKDLVEQAGIVTSSSRLKDNVTEHQPESSKDKDGLSQALQRNYTCAEVEPTANQGSPYPQHEEATMSKKHLNEVEKNSKRESIYSHTASVIRRPASNEEQTSTASPRLVSNGCKTTSDHPETGHGQETVAATHPKDTPEEAALRREMIQYGLGEVGAIVAELELEENGTDVSYDEDGDFEEEEMDDDGESEDENGMVKHPAMDTKYLQKMKELERKHGIKGMQNMGSDTSKLPKDVQSQLKTPPAAEAARKAALTREAKTADAVKPATSHTKLDSEKQRKKVAFAEDLDIAPEKGSQTASNTISKYRLERLSLVDPIKDSIVEHQPAAHANTTQIPHRTTARKASKFKAARETLPQTPLLPPSPTTQLQQLPPEDKPKTITPPHKTHADSIIERNITSTPTPPTPDDIDEVMHRQEIAGEYYKLRNRMIHRQGGFVGEGEADNYGEEMTPLPMVDETGKEKKISRFMAARLR